MTTKTVELLRKAAKKALGAGDTVEAQKCLSEVVQKDPLSVETRGLELELLVRTGKVMQALERAKGLQKLYPTSPGIMYWCGRAAYAKGDYLDAAELFREALRLNPHHAVERYLGKALTNAGRFGEAHAVVGPLAEQYARAKLDLAWLHERQGQTHHAVLAVEAYLETNPSDERAKEKLVQLKAKQAGAEEIVEEVESLVSYGDDVPEAMSTEYFGHLLDRGQRDRAQAFVNDQIDTLPLWRIKDMGWKAYKRGIWDLATQLWVKALPKYRHQDTLRASLSKAARLSGRLGEIIEAYQLLAQEDPSLHGIVTKLQKMQR